MILTTLTILARPDWTGWAKNRILLAVWTRPWRQCVLLVLLAAHWGHFLPPCVLFSAVFFQSLRAETACAAVALPYRAWIRRWAATCRPRRPTSRRAPRRGRAGGSTHPAHCQGDKRVNSTLIGTSCVRVFAVCQPALHHNGKMARGKKAAGKCNHEQFAI